MGLNFYAVCHTHREAMMVSRGDEHPGLHSFYREHQDCRRKRPDTVQVQGDGYGEQEWMDSASGYAQWYFTAREFRDEPAAERYGMGWRVPEV